MWVTTGELADCMSPGCELSNTVAKIGISVLKKSCGDNKVIFPWIVTKHLQEGKFNSNVIKMNFRRDGLYTLSHKQLVPVLF